MFFQIEIISDNALPLGKYLQVIILLGKGTEKMEETLIGYKGPYF
jgi:hypothetical protein